MIDWTRVSDLRDEIGPEDFDEVVELFLSEVDEEIAGLDRHQTKNGLVEQLHFLKGSAMNLGFSAFSDLCSLGELALSRDPSAAVDLDALRESYLASRTTFLSDLPTRLSA